MKPHEFKDLLEKFERGECNENEIKLINEWYDAIHVEQVAHVEPVEIEARLWSSIDPESSVNQTTRFPFWMKAAATLLLLLIAGLGSYVIMHKGPMQEDQIATQEDKTVLDDAFVTVVNNDRIAKEVVLDDGSKITLKADGKIRYAKAFTGPTREVFLDGEAFFRVKRDTQRPFFVYTNEVVTKVLGTSFNVKAYKNDKEITVAVKSGKVSVSANMGQNKNALRQQSVILTPNQEVVYNRVHESVSKRLVEKPEIVLPVPTGLKMQYDGAPVTKIFEELEENYGVDIQFESETFKDCVLTTSMSDEGLYERIQVICKAINAEYVETDGIIVIKSRNRCR